MTTNLFDIDRALRRLIAHYDIDFFSRRRVEIETVIESLLENHTTQNLKLLETNLDSLAHLEGIQGVAEIAQQRPSGWHLLQGWLTYATLSGKARVRLFRLGVKLASNDYSALNLATRALAHAIATRQDNEAHWWGQLLVTTLEQQTDLYREWHSPFDLFIPSFYRRWSTQQLVVPAMVDSRFGIYARLLYAWDDPAAFQVAVNDACVYHCSRAVRMNGPYHEFVREPHNYCPVELLALFRVRIDQRLPILPVSHPLLRTDLATIPDTILPFQARLLAGLRYWLDGPE